MKYKSIIKCLVVMGALAVSCYAGDLTSMFISTESQNYLAAEQCESITGGAPGDCLCDVCGGTGSQSCASGNPNISGGDDCNGCAGGGVHEHNCDGKPASRGTVLSCSQKGINISPDGNGGPYDCNSADYFTCTEKPKALDGCEWVAEEGAQDCGDYTYCTDDGTEADSECTEAEPGE